MWLKGRETDDDSDHMKDFLKREDFKDYEIDVSGFEEAENQLDDEITSEDEIPSESEMPSEDEEGETNFEDLKPYDKDYVSKMVDDALKVHRGLHMPGGLTRSEDARLESWIRLMHKTGALSIHERNARNMGRAILDIGRLVFTVSSLAFSISKVRMMRKVARPHLLQKLQRIKDDERLNSAALENLAKAKGVYEISSKLPRSSNSRVKGKR